MMLPDMDAVFAPTPNRLCRVAISGPPVPHSSEPRHPVGENFSKSSELSIGLCEIEKSVNLGQPGPV
jgi:hypothetical protein